MRAYVNAQHPEAAMLPPRYPSDLSDEEWQILELLLSSTLEKRGRPLTGVVLTPGRGCSVF